MGRLVVLGSLIKLGIPAALEKALMELDSDPGSANLGDLWELLAPIIEGIKAERGKEKEIRGISYYSLVETFKSVLGPRLLLPPNPSKAWIIRMVRRAKDMGYDIAQLTQLATVAGSKIPPGRNGVDLEWLLYRGNDYLAENTKTREANPGNVRIGRSSEDLD